MNNKLLKELKDSGFKGNTWIFSSEYEELLPSPSTDELLEWLEPRNPTLQKGYGGDWEVAILEPQLIGSAPKPRESLIRLVIAINTWKS